MSAATKTGALSLPLPLWSAAWAPVTTRGVAAVAHAIANAAPMVIRFMRWLLRVRGSAEQSAAEGDRRWGT